MKIKLEELKPNPFKKEINGGKINEEKVERIAANLGKDKLGGLANTLPIVNRGKDVCLVFGHNRIAAMKKKYGGKFEIEVTVQTYNDDELFKMMVLENLTQSKNEFDEEENNIMAIYRYLDKNKNILHALRESRCASKTDKLGRKNNGSLQKKKFQNTPTSQDISKWIDNETGKVMSHDTINKLLNIGLNLDESLLKITEKKHNKKWKEEDGSLNRGDTRNTLNSTQAGYLATFKDKNEQKKLAKALMTTREDHVRNQSELITKYKKLKDKENKSEKEKKIIEEVLSGKKDIADLAYPIIDTEVKFNKTVEERFIVLRDSLGKVAGFMEDLQSTSHDKKYIEKATLYELSETYKYLWSWSKNALSPFVKELLEEINRKSEHQGEKTDVIVFDFEEKMKGGKIK